MRRLLVRTVAVIAVLGWLAFVVAGETAGMQALAAAASAFEAWFYSWSAFPVLLAFSLGAGILWFALRLLRWRRGRPWLKRLAELHEEGVTLRELGVSMTDIASLPSFLRGIAEWEDRSQRVIAERAKVDAVTFRAPPTMLHPELRAKYLSDEHRIALETHAERLRRLGGVIERRAAG